MSCTLIQIISEETMPNLLAAMALKPKKVIHLCTPSMKKASESLACAYKQAWVELEVHEEFLSAHPGMLEMNKVVADVIGRETDPVLNFTGGTKLMSIGAYAAATRAKICSVYVDTAAGEFVDGLSGGGFAALFPDGSQIERVSRQLTVNAVARANGVERVSGGKKWKEYAELADILLRNPSYEQKCHEIADGWVKKEPRNFAKVKEFYQGLYSTQFRLPEKIADAAVRAGLYEYCGEMVLPAGKWFRKLQGCDPKTVSPAVMFDAIDDARWPLSFFHGNWWEVAVMRFFSNCGRYRDLRWSVDAGSRGGASTDMEEDVLGIDGVNLLYVSCKRGGDKAKLSRVLEDVNSSAKRIGGRFARKMLAVFIDLNGAQATRVRNRCSALHIDLLDRATVATVEPWTPEA